MRILVRSTNEQPRGVTAVVRACVLLSVLIALPMSTVVLMGGQPEPAQEEFVPIDQLPPEDQLPAAPLLVGAYAIVWLAVFGYLWTIWRRLSTVEQELSELSRRVGSGDERS